MIPRDYITQWRDRAPWTEDFQVEQDLVISRALVEIFSDPVLAAALAFRGGTALYKLYLTPAARYSEDIDLVQVEPGPAGPMMDALRSALDPWLGEAQWKQSRGRVTFGYRFLSEDVPAIQLRLNERYSTEILIVPGGRIQFLEKPNRADAAAQPQAGGQPDGGADLDDEIPFQGNPLRTVSSPPPGPVRTAQTQIGPLFARPSRPCTPDPGRNRGSRRRRNRG